MGFKDERKTIRDYLVHGIFFTFYGIVKYLPSPIGDWLRYVFVKPFIKKIGSVRISEGVTFYYPYRIQLGNQVTLNEWIMIDGCGEVVIEDNVRIGHRTSILSSDHKFKSRNIPVYKQGIASEKVHIEEDVFIGCNVVILKGVRIGKGAVIGAGSVVTKNVEPYSIVVGVPAEKKGSR